LGEHLVCNQEVIGSIPFTSTIFKLKVESSKLKHAQVFSFEP
jgi:hypothetical protein